MGHAFTSVAWQGSIAVEAMSTADGRIQGALDGVEKAGSDSSPSWFGILVSQDNRAELIFERLDGKLLVYAKPLSHELLRDIAEYAATDRRWIRLIPTDDNASVDVEDWIMHEAVAFATRGGQSLARRTIKQLLRNFDGRVVMVMRAAVPTLRHFVFRTMTS